MCGECIRREEGRLISLEDWTVHILEAHHEWLYQVLPALIADVNSLMVRWDCFAGLHQVLLQLRLDLDEHMAKEEKILFPLIRLMEVTQRPPAELGAMPGTVLGPIHCMEHEHAHTEELLNRLEAVCQDKALQVADIPVRNIITRTQEVIDNVRDHMHKENTILFPQAISLEERLLKHRR